uniref:Uncharacterized protein n=1 Tax=Aegilops tauschii subsp. strangulata TaxID=200361 RepID=A0A453MPW8_AEGTS
MSSSTDHSLTNWHKIKMHLPEITAASHSLTPDTYSGISQHGPPCQLKECGPKKWFHVYADLELHIAN